MSDISFTGFLTKKNINKHQYELEYLLDPSNDQYVRDILPLKIQNFEIRRLEWSDFSGKPNEDMPWIAHCYWNIVYDYSMVEENPSPKLQKQASPLLPPTNKLNEVKEQITISKQSPKLPPKLPLQQQNLQNNNNQLPRINNLSKPPTPAQRTSSAQRIPRQQTPKNSSPLRKVARSNSSSSLKRQSPSRQKIRMSVTCKFLEKSWAKSTYDDDLLEHETGHYLIGCLCALEFKRQIESLGIVRSETHQQEIKQIFQSNLRTFLKIEKDYDEETRHYCDWNIQKKWNHKIKEQLLLYEMYFNY